MLDIVCVVQVSPKSGVSPGSEGGSQCAAFAMGQGYRTSPEVLMRNSRWMQFWAVIVLTLAVSCGPPDRRQDSLSVPAEFNVPVRYENAQILLRQIRKSDVHCSRSIGYPRRERETGSVRLKAMANFRDSYGPHLHSR